MSEEDRLELIKEISIYSKVQLIEKYVNELEENLILTNQWYKTTQKINEAIEYIKNKPLYTETYDYNEEDNLELKYIDDEIAKNDLLEILGDKE